MRLAIASVGKNLSSSLNQSKEGEETESFTDIDRIGRLVREIKGGTLRISLFDLRVRRLTEDERDDRNGPSSTLCEMVEQEIGGARSIFG